MKRIAKVLSLFVLSLACLSFALASQLPLYTDEVTWSALLGRMNHDHGKVLTVTLQPSCGAHYAYPAPLIFVPARWADTWMFSFASTPWRLRLLGLLTAGMWMLVTAMLAGRLLPRASRLRTAAVIAGWCTLGVMPFLLVMSRPEQALLMSTTVLLPLALKPPAATGSGMREAGLAVMLLGVGYWALCAHPRGVFLLPLLCCCLWRTVQGRRLRAASFGALGCISVAVWRGWRPLWSCEGDPQFNRLLAFANFGAARQTGLQAEFLRRLAHTLLTPAGWGLRAFTPNATYTSDMIPAFAMAHAQVLRWLMEAGFAGLLCLAAALCAVCVFRAVRTGRHGMLVLSLVSAWCIFAANTSIRVEKNDYEGAYTEPLIGMLVFAGFWVKGRMAPAGRAQVDAGVERWVPVAVHGLLVSSVLSQICFLAVYQRAALRAWRRGGQPAGQRYSVSVRGYEPAARTVISAGKMCGINPATPHRHLVLDELSYFPFQESEEPMFITYFDPHGWGLDRPDPTELFRAQGVAGMIVHCNRLPEIYRSRAKELDGMCCLPAFTR